MLAAWPNDLLLIVDRTALKDCLWRMELGLAYHGRTLPLSWAVSPGRGVPTETTWERLFVGLLDQAQALPPPGRSVGVLLDRGFVSPRLWDAIRARGWHLVLRATRTVRLRSDDGQEVALGDLLGAGPGLVTRAGAVFKKGGWRVATVTALRRPGQPQAWLLLSDQPAGEPRALEYRVRMHIEEHFRDDKGQG